MCFIFAKVVKGEFFVFRLENYYSYCPVCNMLLFFLGEVNMIIIFSLPRVCHYGAFLQGHSAENL